MSDDIHDLLREIDKALEQVRAVGAIDADLSLKLPRAAQPAFEALCVVRDPLHRPGSRYQGIPITEWTDGPFMSFSLDHKVIFDHTMPDTFYGKGVSGAVERIMPATGGLVRGWDFGLVGERPNPFPAGVFMREPLTAEVCCDAAAPCEKHSRITTDADTVTIQLTFEGGLEREWKPGDSPVLPAVETYEEGGLRVRFIDPEKSYVTAEECKAYVVTRLKASEPLACRSCGRTDGHDAKCPSDILSKMLGMFGAAHSSAMAEARKADEERARKRVMEAHGVTEDDLRAINAEMRPLTADDFNSLLGPSTISKLLARRRKLIAKAKRSSPDDAAVGSAIAAMNKPGRANEL